MKTQEKYLDAKLENIEPAIDFIDNNLVKIKVKKKERIKAELLAEEFIAHIINNKSEGDSDQIRVAVSKTGHEKTVIVSYKGKEVKNLDNIGFSDTVSFMDMSAETESFIRKKLISANKDTFHCGYKNGINKISITVAKPVSLALQHVLLTFLLAFIVGFILRFLFSTEISHFVSENILHTIENIFLNAFKLITAPIVFFSVASSISSFSDLKELGKMAGKYLFIIFFSAAVTLVIGFGLYAVFSPGEVGEFKFMASGSIAEAEEINPTELITGIIPSNIIMPFLELSTLQIIVIAVLVGIAAGKLGEKSSKVSDFLTGASELFFKITDFLTRFLHIMIFASVTSLVMTIKPETTGAIFKLILCIFLGFALTFLFYNLLVMITTKTSPIKFIKRTYPVWINGFSLHSSNAAISYTMDVCEKRLKIPSKVYSFTIPLGASINMDDLDVIFSLSILFFAKVFGIGLKPSDFLLLVIMIVVLSIGTPGMPSGGTISFTLLLSQFAIPMEALAIFISIYALVDPFATGNNVFGNAAKTFIVSESLKRKQKKNKN